MRWPMPKWQRNAAMMHDGMGGDMMWGMGPYGLIALMVTILLIAALLKYLFFS